MWEKLKEGDIKQSARINEGHVFARPRETKSTLFKSEERRGINSKVRNVNNTVLHANRNQCSTCEGNEERERVRERQRMQDREREREFKV